LVRIVPDHSTNALYKMAVGPFARLLAQVIVPAIAVIARALPAAYAQALQNARKAGGGAASTTAGNASNLFSAKKMSTQEAKLILNLDSDGDVDPDAMEKHYQKYMAANEVKKIPGSSMNTGSFYLQSKIYRAREALRQAQEEQKQPKKESSASQ
jgi:mitochondrial import inner membrane translocase subunit TIM16